MISIDWKKAAIEDLRIYAAQKQSLKNIPERIEGLREDKFRIKGSTLSAVPMHGGASRYEDKLLNCITEIGRLEELIPPIQRKVTLIEKGLSGLSDTERKVLDGFYIMPTNGSVQRLAMDLGYEQRQVYRIRDAALYRYTITMFGLCDY